ncbi:MAG: DUF5908 family protein [Bacteroidota bacterium]
MAIEIRELVIRTNIVDDTKMSASRPENGNSSLDERLIIERCVEKVLRKLGKKRER